MADKQRHEWEGDHGLWYRAKSGSPLEVARGKAAWVETTNSRAAADEILRLAARERELTAKLLEWEEKEAECCPEDVGFPEYVAALETAGVMMARQHEGECGALRARVAELEARLPVVANDGRNEGYSEAAAVVRAVWKALRPGDIRGGSAEDLLRNLPEWTANLARVDELLAENEALRGDLGKLDARLSKLDTLLASDEGDIALEAHLAENTGFSMASYYWRMVSRCAWRWFREALGLPAEPERKEWYFEAKDLLAHPDGHLAVEWHRAEMAEAMRELRAEIAEALALLAPSAPGETLDGAIRNLQQAYLTERDNAASLEADNETLRAKVEELEEAVSDIGAEAIEANVRVGRLDDLLASREPEVALEAHLAEKAGFSMSSYYWRMVSLVAWRWFQEQLTAPPAEPQKDDRDREEAGGAP